MTDRDRVADLLDVLRVPRETMLRLDQFVGLLHAESQKQNLVSARSLETVWDRHILDSLQLLTFAPPVGSWLDIGSGAGLPGLVIAATERHEVMLVEPRRKRVDFLRHAADALGLSSVTIVLGKVEAVTDAHFDVISARAVASLDQLFSMSFGLSRPDTRFIFPKGRSASAELDTARASWQGEFRVEPSVSDPDAAIIVAQGVRPRGRR